MRTNFGGKSTNSVQNDLIEGRGLITKRHDSNHHKTAILTLDDIWVFVINQTIAHNMMTMAEYPMTRNMVNKFVHPIPLEFGTMDVRNSEHQDQLYRQN